MCIFKIINNIRVRRKNPPSPPPPRKNQNQKKWGKKKAIGLPKFMYNYFDDYLPLQKLARKLWKQESEKRAHTLRKRKAWQNIYFTVRASTHSYGLVAPTDRSPRVFCHAHSCKSSAAAGERKNLPPQKKEKGRERENQGSTAMHDGKEKKGRKQKEKVGYF
jgi:hypothetical protein